MFTFPVAHFAGESAYEIAQSLDFESSSSAELTRTFGSAGNRRTWSLSWWVKRESVGTRQMMFTVTAAGGAQGIIEFSVGDGSGGGGDNKLVFNNETSGTTALNWELEVAFDSTSDWYHFLAVYDTTQSDANNRLKCFVNGTAQTAWHRIATPAQNQEQAFNNALEHNIGGPPAALSMFYDGLMAEIIFIDGVAKSVTDFGKTSGSDWVPVEYDGAFPGNSFHIDGRDSSDLGDDESGNGNDFSNSNVAQSSTTPTS